MLQELKEGLQEWPWTKKALNTGAVKRLQLKFSRSCSNRTLLSRHCAAAPRLLVRSPGPWGFVLFNVAACSVPLLRLTSNLPCPSSGLFLPYLFQAISPKSEQMIDRFKARNKWTCWAIRPPFSQHGFEHPVVGATSSVYKGWSFLCCDRQNDPSDLSGLQLKAEQALSGQGLAASPLIKG